MKLLFDANVLLDVLLKRDPWVKEATRLWQAVEDEEISGYLVASILTDIFYITRRATSIEIAKESVGICMDSFEILGLDREVLKRAYDLEGNDFEDNVQIASAEMADLDGIVTRDPKGYAHTKLQVWSPIELIKFLGFETET